MLKVHNGVLIPDDLANASGDDLDAYADRVKIGNRAFVDAYFALEDEAIKAGIHPDELDA